MEMTKWAFCLKYNMEVQWVTALCDKGIIRSQTKLAGKRHWIIINDGCMENLVKGKHFVECPICHKKMACVTQRHINTHPGIDIPSSYCELYLLDHKKTEKQKKYQSRVLKKRFKTPEGEITRRIIGEASKKLNADPVYKAKSYFLSLKIQPESAHKQRKTSKEIWSRPEIREAASKAIIKRWASPPFRKKMEKYVQENIEQLKESARKARSYQKKQSKIHIAYKEKMLEQGLKHFISEYGLGPYKIDEADPLAKIAIEIDGCFWHGCSVCKMTGDPKMLATDKRKNSFLKNRGWIIFRIKEHELRKNPYTAIEMIRNIQEKRRQANLLKIKQSFWKGNLKVRSMVEGKMEWVPMSDILRHNTPHKRMFKVMTEIGSVTVTEDHSLFNLENNPIQSSTLKAGDSVIGLPGKEFEPIKVLSCEEVPPELHTYDISVPGTEKFVLESGILAHNSYSISGVSLDIEKSSKYQVMKEEFNNQYDKLVEAAKRSIKIIKGLRQFRYGIGITSALGPLSRPGVQSRRNFISSGAPVWS